MTPREIRRCRAMLGTFVEIAAWGRETRVLERAVGAAFDAVASLQSVLSAHDPASELSRLNRGAHARPMRVGRDTWRVLRSAARLARQSGGAFDATLEGRSRFIEFHEGRRVRYVRPLRVDLGGIAKGYCVDRAVTELRHRGVRGGIVNAGGDLRAFGARAYSLHLRHPADPSSLCELGVLRDAALATSASYAAGNARRSARGGMDLRRGLSVSVRAPSAMLADALTKVVAAAGPGAGPLLKRYRARAWVVAA